VIRPTPIWFSPFHLPAIQEAVPRQEEIDLPSGFQMDQVARGLVGDRLVQDPFFRVEVVSQER
jgi:hypothetical protein